MKKAKQFLNVPEYPGGREAFKKYIKDNLIYPQAAIENRIEGVVHLWAEIDDNGDVIRVGIKNRLGYGCDEEAIRLLKSAKYTTVKNRGKRLKVTKKARIEFKLPIENRPNFTLNSKRKEVTQVTQNVPVKKYTYTIQLNKNEN